MNHNEYRYSNEIRDYCAFYIFNKLGMAVESQLSRKITNFIDTDVKNAGRVNMLRANILVGVSYFYVIIAIMKGVIKDEL